MFKYKGVNVTLFQNDLQHEEYDIVIVLSLFDNVNEGFDECSNYYYFNILELKWYAVVGKKSQLVRRKERE